MSYKKVSEIMTKNVRVVPPNATLVEAAEEMRSSDIGILPVCDDERVQGLVSDRDIVIRAIANGKVPAETFVREIMTAKVVYIFEDQDILEAAHLMELKQVHRLIVLDRNKRLSGIISLGDVAVLQKDKSLSGEILREVSKPPKDLHA